MRPLFTALALLLAAPLAAGAAEDPPGTEPVSVVLHRSTPIKTGQQGTTAVCDDPAVASPELTEEGLVLRGLSLGTTLCGLRGVSGQQLGLLRVTVVAPPPPKSKSPAQRQGAADDDGPPTPRRRVR